MIARLARSLAAWWARYTTQKLCGHHWHCESEMGTWWRCCNCAKETDHFPLPDRADCLVNRPGRPPLREHT
jgi:hypothetical protein